MRKPFGRRWWSALAALACFTVLMVGACLHDWAEWLPEGNGTAAGSGTGTATGTTTGTPAGTASGINTGGSVPGSCPHISNSTTLVKVNTLTGTATCIDRTEVTKQQYAQWLGTSPDPIDQPAYCQWNDSFDPQDSRWPPPAEDYGLPVIGVDWCDAYAYCAAHNKRLCSGLDGVSVPPNSRGDPYYSEWHNSCTQRAQTEYPYPGAYDPEACHGVESAAGAGGQPAAVDAGAMPDCVTAEGVYDLSGNIWEWEDSCSAWNDDSDLCAIRGGGFNAGQADMRCAAATPSARGTKTITVGFRCCRAVDP